MVPTTMRFCPQDGTEIAPAVLGVALANTYEFIEAVGSGGMSVIYKARHRALNRFVAIKMLHGHMLTDNVIMRFQQEAKASSLLVHPNTVAVHDFGITESGQPYMVMDFIEGETLANVIQRQGALPVEDCIKIISQVCDAVEHAHENGILHRDLKPSNIMLIKMEGTPGIVKIVDFGIAKIMDASGSSGQNLTRTGELFGSPLYMSPEQCAGAKELDRRSDIYSLGCVMYECLTGTVPHRGETLVGTIVKHMNEQPIPISEMQPDTKVPSALEDIVDKALEKNPDKRFQTMEELKKALWQVRDRMNEGAAGGAGSIKRVLRKIRPARRPTLAIGALALLAVTIAASMFFAHSNHDSTGSGGAVPSARLPHQKSEYAAANQKALQFFSVAEHKKVTDRLIAENLPFDVGITQLDLNKTSITDNGLVAVGKQRMLTSLSLVNTKIDDLGLRYLSDLDLLKSLDLRGTVIDDQGLKFIPCFSKLRNLNLCSTIITDDGLTHLRQLNQLTDLTLSLTAISGKGLQHITHLPLQMLRLDGTRIKDSEFGTIGEFTSLRDLRIGNSKLTGKGFGALNKLTALTQLHMGDCYFADENVHLISQFPLLEELCAGKTHITDAGLVHLPGLAKLWNLEIFENDITDVGMKYILQLPELRRLMIYKTKVTDAGLRNIADLSKLEELDVSSTDVTDASMPLFAKLPNLKRLTLRHCPKITAKAKEEFHKSLPKCRMDQ